MYDSIVATLPCPECGEPCEGEIQTRIRGGAADGATFRVGSAFKSSDLTGERLRRAGYLPIRPPAAGRPLRVLDMWSCFRCGGERWAQLEFADGVLASVEPVELTRAILDGAHFISGVNADWAARSLGDESEDPAVDVLRKRLPG